MADPVLGVAARLAGDAVKPGIGWLLRWWGARKILIIGQGRAGKTNFFRYLLYGHLGRYGEGTAITNEPQESDMFTFNLPGAAGRSLEVTVRKTTDMPGQIGPFESARKVARQRPDVVVVMLDLTTPQTGDPNSAFGTWYEVFCSSLLQFISKRRGMKAKPVAILTLLNKYDEFVARGGDTVALEKIVADLRQTLEKWLLTEFGPRIRNFQFLPTCAVHDPLVPTRCDPALIDRALEEIGFSLT